MPRLEIHGDRPLPGAELIDGDGNIVGDFQERHDAAGSMFVAVDVGAHSTYLHPIPADAAAEFAQQGHLFVSIEDPFDVVRGRSDVAGTELVAGGAGVGECRGRSHHFKLAHDVIELFGPGLGIKLVLSQKHRHPHKKVLRELDGFPLAVFDQITIIQRTNPEVGKLLVTLRTEVGIQVIQIVLVLEAEKDAPFFFATFEIITQMDIAGVAGNLVIEVVEEEACRDKRPVGTIDVDLVHGGLDQGLLDLCTGDHVPEMELGVHFQFALAHIVQAFDSCRSILLDFGDIQCFNTPISFHYSNHKSTRLPHGWVLPKDKRDFTQNLLRFLLKRGDFSRGDIIRINYIFQPYALPGNRAKSCPYFPKTRAKILSTFLV